MRTSVKNAAGAAMLLVMSGLSGNLSSAIASDAPDCGIAPSGTVDTQDVPEGTDVVDCDLVGQPLDLGETVLTIPDPGQSVQLTIDGVEGEGLMAEVRTALGGEISYELELEADLAEAAAGVPAATLTKNGCDDDYLGATTYKYVRSIWKMYVGDGALPAGGTASQLASAINAAGKTWSTENSPCYPTDLSLAPDVIYGGLTTTEADITESAGETVCTAADGTSTVDAGNLAANSVAANCTWTNASGTVTESDIRFNTTDRNFNYGPTSGCTTGYDVLSVLTHEMGHTYGMKDKVAASSQYQTMYYSSFPCATHARDLGKSDVRHLRNHYPT